MHQVIEAAIRMNHVISFQHPVDMLHAESYQLMPAHGYRLAVFGIDHRGTEPFTQKFLIAFQLSFVTERQFSVAFFLMAQPFDLAMQCIQ